MEINTTLKLWKKIAKLQFCTSLNYEQLPWIQILKANFKKITRLQYAQKGTNSFPLFMSSMNINNMFFLSISNCLWCSVSVFAE